MNEEMKQSKIEHEREEKDVYFRQAPDSLIVNEEQLAFPGLKYYPVDASYRLKVKLNRYPSPETVTMTTSARTQRNYALVGYFEFKLDEKKQRLQVYKSVPTPSFEDKTLFVPFRDKTSGAETYGAGRYIDIPENDRGEYEPDFNRAYNPYCAYSENYVCPITPNENWLDVAIRAGEKSYKH